MGQPFLTEKEIQNKVTTFTNCQLVYVLEGEENFYLITGIGEDSKPYLAQFWHDFKSPWFESREHGTPTSQGSSKSNLKLAPLMVPKPLAAPFLESLKTQVQEQDLRLIERAMKRLALI